MTVFVERRLANDGKSTACALFLGERRLGFTLEPGPRTPAHPRKPAGRYELVLRREGGKFEKYRHMFAPGLFPGIPHILVPGRTWIEVHPGNTKDETEGCSLTGTKFVGPMLSLSGHYEVCNSRDAFRAIYPVLRDDILAGPCWWETIDEGTAPGGIRV